MNPSSAVHLTFFQSHKHITQNFSHAETKLKQKIVELSQNFHHFLALNTFATVLFFD